MKPLAVGVFILLVTFLTSSSVFSQEIPLDPGYCGGPGNDYYVIPGEPQYGDKPCSRAPEACGNDYDSINTDAKMPDYNACMGNGDAERAQKGCAGYVPACCYEMARTGDFTKCVGYWERLWCAKSQCDEARSKGASDSQCGDTCQCSHAFSDYCGENTQPVPLSQRIAGITAPPSPTVTNTATPTTVTNPTPTTNTISTPTPTTVNQPTATPTTSQISCDQLKKQGNFNCTGGVDEDDFSAWKQAFLGQGSSLAHYEYWRRVSF